MYAVSSPQPGRSLVGLLAVVGARPRELPSWACMRRRRVIGTLDANSPALCALIALIANETVWLPRLEICALFLLTWHFRRPMARLSLPGKLLRASHEAPVMLLLAVPRTQLIRRLDNIDVAANRRHHTRF